MSIKNYNESILITDTTKQEVVYVSPLSFNDDIVGYYPLSFQDIRILKEIKKIINNGHSANVCISYQNLKGIND